NREDRTVPMSRSVNPLVATGPGPSSRTPNGIRTRATAVKGRGPRPLDDGGSERRPVYNRARVVAPRGTGGGWSRGGDDAGRVRGRRAGRAGPRPGGPRGADGQRRGARRGRRARGRPRPPRPLRAPAAHPELPPAGGL